MDKGTVQVEAGARVVRDVGEKFVKIIYAVQDLAGEIQSVAAATKEISSAMQNVAAATEEQTTTIEEISSTTQNLACWQLTWKDLPGGLNCRKDCFWH